MVKKCHSIMRLMTSWIRNTKLMHLGSTSGAIQGQQERVQAPQEDKENVNPELVELFDECMSAPFGERADKWKEHRHRFLEVGEDKFYQYDEGP